MNIGYCKFTMNIELNYANAKLGNAESRATLLRALIGHGHKITIYSQVKKQDEELLMSKKKIEPVNSIDLDWIRHIKYKPDKPVDTNTDLLFVETGPDNLTFRTKFNNREPFIRRCANILNSYQGIVFFLNTDPDLPFPIHKMAHCKYPYLHKKNVYRNGAGSHPDHGWADPKEILKDKKLIFFNQAYNQKAYNALYDRSRSRIQELGYESHMLPVVYDKALVPLRQLQKPFPAPYGIVYIGYPRKREKLFEKFVMGVNINGNPPRTWGPWDKKTNYNFKERAIFAGVNIGPFLDNYYQCCYRYYQATCTIVLASDKSRKCGVITHRTLESIHSGCLTFGIKDHSHITEYIDEEFLVDSKNDLIRKISKYSDRNKYFEALEKQRNKIDKYNGKMAVRYFMKKLMEAR